MTKKTSHSTMFKRQFTMPTGGCKVHLSALSHFEGMNNYSKQPNFLRKNVMHKFEDIASHTKTSRMLNVNAIKIILNDSHIRTSKEPWSNYLCMYLNGNLNMYAAVSWTVSAQNLYVEVLAPSTSEYNYIWRYYLERENWIKMRSLGWDLNQITIIFIGKD